MDRNKYSILAEIEKHGSLSKTADFLGYTQSNISHMVKSMESECGFPLLIRNTTPIRLTPEAKSLLPSIAKIADAEKDALCLIQQIRCCQSHSLHIGIPGSIPGKWLWDLNCQYHTCDPQTELTYTYAPSSALSSALLSGEADCCFLLDNTPAHCYSLFLTEIPVLLAAPKSDLEISQSFPVNSASKLLPYLCPDAALHNIIRNKYPEIQFHTLLTQPSDAAIVMMIQDSLGFSMLPRTSLPLSYRRLKVFTPEVPVTVRLYIAVTPEKRRLPPVANYLHVAEQYFYQQSLSKPKAKI